MLTIASRTRSRRFRFLALSLPALALAALTACQEPMPPAGKVDPLPQGSYPRNVARNDLDKAIVFGEAIVMPGTPDKPMRVIQPIRSTADHMVRIQYKFDFIDGNRMPLKTNQGWRYLELPAMVERQLDQAAPDAGAVDWRLEIRSAK